MPPLTIHLTICAAFTAALNNLANALAGATTVAPPTQPDNVLPFANDVPSTSAEEDKPRRGRKPKADVQDETRPVPTVAKVDRNAQLTAICDSARAAIKDGKVTTAQIKGLAEKHGAAKLSELPATDALDDVSADLDALLAGDTGDDGV